MLAKLLPVLLAFSAFASAQSPQLPPMARSNFPVDAANEAMFLVLFGEKTGHPEDWSGRVEVRNGELEAIKSYKFTIDDAVSEPNGWRIAARQAPQRKAGLYFPSGYQGEPSAGVIVTLLENPGCNVEVASTRGNFSFRPSDMRVGDRRMFLNDDASVARLPVARKIGSTWWNDDFPTIASDRNGVLWVAWAGQHSRQDEIGLRSYKDGRWSNYMPVPGNQGDSWLPQVLIDENNDPWVIYAQQIEGNWDLYSARYRVESNRWTDVEAITDHWMTDTNHAATIDSEGNIYVAWQALRGKHFDIRFKRRDAASGGWSKEYVVTAAEGNDWKPAIAIDSTGRAWIAWDSYRNGNYDVFLRSIRDGELGEEIAVATTARLDKRVSLAVDGNDRVWIAWEQGAVNWGKDLGYTEPEGGGASLGGPRAVQIAVWDGSKLVQPAAQPDAAAIVGSGSFHPRLFVDGSGNVGLQFQRRLHNTAGQGWWEQQLSIYQGDRWTTPTPLPLSWGRPDTRGAVAVQPSGGLWAVYSTDNRDYPFPHRPVRAEIYAARMPSWPAVDARLSARREEPATAPPAHDDEVADVARIRGYRTVIDGRESQIIRGDTHRHTDMSWDGGGTTDGSFDEFWRYMIDAAEMDWGNVSDHQGGGTYMDYFWWLQGKIADMYNMPGRYTAMFGYERGMLFPDGHRNVVAAERSLRVLPFLREVNWGKMRQPAEVPPGGGDMAANDVPFLYQYLHKLDAFTLSHTSANSMGTDWRDNDPAVEPVVEIFQGARMSYEQIGAPRAVQRILPDGKPSPKTAAGSFQPEGYVNNAWAKGYRLGVVASSDHNSTHMSYAMVYTEDRSRSGVVRAVKRRNTYGATDNIILEYRIGDRFMGSDFEADELEPLSIYVRGTRPVAKVTILRDQQVIHTATPNSLEVDFEYVDNEVTPGDHYYYVRVEQVDGELAWSSPIWVRLTR